MKKYNIIGILLLGLSVSAFSQNEFSLEQCVEYALENHSSIKNAELDYRSSKAKVGETRAVGLPQVNGKWDFMNNMNIQKQFVTANTFNPFASEDSIISFGFGLDYSSNLNVTVSQLVFDGSYIMGLKAAKTYKELYKNTISKSKSEVVASVSKAYYMALITSDRASQMKKNEDLLIKLLSDTKTLSEAGMVEGIDLKRTQVNLNNLKSEINKITSMNEVTLNLLKFQMGMPIAESLALSESLDKLTVDIAKSSAAIDYDKNADFQILGVQKTLNTLNLKNEKIRFLPNLGAFLSLGANYGTNNFGDVFGFDNYKGYSLVGATLNVPIFASGQRKFRVDQAKIELEKTNNNIEYLKHSIDMQSAQYSNNLNDNLEVLKTQKENLDLAKEVFDISQTKYTAGMASNFEVLSAQTDLKTSQTNYYNALYDVLIAQIELKTVSGDYNIK